jgi:hypothetical protein
MWEKGEILEALAPLHEEESATTCMQLRTDYLQGSARSSLLAERVPPCSAAIRRSELFTKLCFKLYQTHLITLTYCSASWLVTWWRIRKQCTAIAR